MKLRSSVPAPVDFFVNVALFLPLPGIRPWLLLGSGESTNSLPPDLREFNRILYALQAMIGDDPAP
jgi:hypothetical protein